MYGQPSDLEQILTRLGYGLDDLSSIAGRGNATLALPYTSGRGA